MPLLSAPADAGINGLDIRTAGPADQATVAEVMISSRRVNLPYAVGRHSDDEARRWVAAHMWPTHRVLVAELGGQIIGVAAMAWDQGVDWLNQFYVAPGWSGRGVGGRMMPLVLAATGRPLRLHCFQRNLGARRFYERHGFVALAFGDGEDNEERCPDVLYGLSTSAGPSTEG